MDNFALAMSRFKRRKFDDAISLCDKMLSINPKDQSAWVLKSHCLVQNHFIDDLELDEEGVGDLMLDEVQLNNLARPGTSFQRPLSSSNSGAINPTTRPMTRSGRPTTGFQRPQTNRPMTGSSNNIRLDTSMKGARPGSTRPITSGGRYMRIGTASLQQYGDQFIVVDKLDLKKLAKKPVISKCLCNYLLYVEPNYRKALELASEGSILQNYQDWWWKERLGKCYFMLGAFKEAEKQFISSLKNQDMVKTHIQLARVYIRLDQPQTALETFKKALLKYPHEVSFTIGIGRVFELLNDTQNSIANYRLALSYESSNLEVLAQIASYHFYIDQPEVALKFYQRLVQLGVNQAEIWNNLGLCCFYDGQYDLFYSCFEKALSLSDSSTKADLWYNISHVFICIGDLKLAILALNLALLNDQHHSEAYNNLGILEIKNQNFEKGKLELKNSHKENEFLFEPVFNLAVCCFKNFDYQDSLTFVQKALQIYPEHSESIQLQRNIMKLIKNM